ncbi:MAG: 2-dehydro-3-deoxygalactonokinase [Betaproteobacteria bacterium]|nr:2-dehydro-3-deoxygalactonokinase [Betaproteobacteria bacterium]
MTVNADGIHDVMRGEETQILGILHDLGPGSHAMSAEPTASGWKFSMAPSPDSGHS